MVDGGHEIQKDHVQVWKAEIVRGQTWEAIRTNGRDRN